MGLDLLNLYYPLMRLGPALPCILEMTCHVEFIFLRGRKKREEKIKVLVHSIEAPKDISLQNVQNL